MDRIRARIGLVAGCGTLVALLVGLHRIGTTPGMQIDWADPVGWISRASVEDTLLALLRTIGLAAGYWILAGTACYALLRHRVSPPHLSRALIPPVVRRLVDRALAASVAISILTTPLGPAMAAASVPEPTVAVYDINRDGIPVPHITPRQSGADVVDGVAGDPIPTIGTVPVAAPGRTDAAVAAAATNYTVVAGDNLWAIAAHRLRESVGTQHSTAVIARYWRRLVAANAGTLRSGDPNLIYPGEVVLLPPVEVSS